MAQRTLTLVVPGLLASDATIDKRRLNTAFPSLCRLLARASYQKIVPSHTGSSIYTGCHIDAVTNETPPVAYYHALQAGLDVEAYSWLLFDLLNVKLDAANVFALTKPTLSQQQREAIAQQLHDHIVQDGHCLHTPAQGQWLLGFRQHKAFVLTPYHTIVGKSLVGRLPEGKDAVYWRRLMTECQMLLQAEFPAFVDNDKQMSVWLSGYDCNNTTPDVNMPLRTQTACYTDCDAVRGMMKHVGVTRVLPLPDCLQLDAMCDTPHMLVTMDLLANMIFQGEMAYWHEAMIDLEEDWFAPIAQALSARQLSRVELITHRYNFILTPKHMLRWWRFNQRGTTFFHTTMPDNAS